MNLVPPEHIAAVFPAVKEWLDAAIKRNQGDESFWDVFVAIAQNRYLLWHEPEKFAAVVQIQKFPQHTVAVVLYLGGQDLEAMKGKWDEAKQWCRDHGISAIRTYGRDGWARVLDLKPIGSILQVNL